MQSHRPSQVILIADTAWIALALAVSYALRFWLWHGRAAPVAAVYILLGLGAIVAWAAIYRAMALDCFRGGWQWSAAFSRIATGVAMLLAVLLALAYVAQVAYSRLLLAGFGVLLAGGFMAIRAATLHWVLRRRRQGAARRVVLVGNDHTTRELALLLARHPEFFYEVVGVAYPYGSGGAPLPEYAAGESGPLGSLALLEMLRRLNVSEVLLLLQEMPFREHQNFQEACERLGIIVRMVPRSYQLFSARPRLIDVGGVPLLSYEPGPSPAMMATKRAMDLLLTLLVSPLVAPLIALLALATRASGARPVFVSELRCGRAGRPFRMWRFNASREATRGFAHWLVRTSLSELPQVWNVLRGEMGLVGPRPEPPERVKHYGAWENQRLGVTPGLTGLAQVHGLREINATREKARFDLQYLAEWSPLFDLTLLVQTPLVLAARLWRGRSRTLRRDPELPVASASASALHADRT